MRASDFLDAPDTAPSQGASAPRMKASEFLDAPDTPVQESGTAYTRFVESNPVTSAFVGAGGGLVKAGVGAIQGVAQAMGADETARAAGNAAKEINSTVSNLGTAGKVGMITGEIAPYLAAPSAAPTMVGRALLSGASGAAQGLLQAQETPDAGKRFKDAAVQGAIGLAAVPVIEKGAKIISGAGGAAAKAIKNTGPAAIDAVVGKVDANAAGELASQGFDVTRLAAASGKSGSDFVRGYLRNTFIGGKMIENAGKKASQQGAMAADDVLAKVGNVTDAAGAGEKIISGLDTAKRVFNSEAEKLYGEADKLLPQGFIKLSNLRAVVDTTDDKLAGLSWRKVVRSKDMEALADDVLTAIKDASAKGRTNVQTMKAVRSNIGKLLDDAPFNSPEQRFWKRAYGALSQDLEAAAKEGAPGAVEAIQKANAFYRTGRGELTKQFARYGGRKEVEDAFKAVASPDALRNAPQRVTQLFDRLPQANRKVVGATLIRRLGQKVDGGEFDLVHFATKWDAVAPKAKAAIANGADNAAEINKLVRNIRRVQPSLEAVSRTGEIAAGRTSDVAAALGVFYAPFMSAAKFAMDGGLGWALTKPQNLRVLNKALSAGTPEAAAQAARMLAVTLPNGEAKTLMQQAHDLITRSPVSSSGAPVSKAIGKGAKLNSRPEVGLAALGVSGAGAAGVTAGGIEAGRQGYEADAEAQLGQTQNQLGQQRGMVQGRQSTQQPRKDEIGYLIQSLPPAQVSSDIISKIARVESSNNPEAKAGTSSALGLHQFTAKTWLDVLEKHEPELMVGMTKADLLRLRKNPEVSKRVAGYLVDDNASILEKSGVPITDATIYLAHFAGAGKAVDLLKADPSTPVARVVGSDAVRANRKVLGGKTVGQVLAWAERKMR